MDKRTKKIKVIALPAFKARRFATLQGLLKLSEFRKLRAGKAIFINEKYFDETLFMEVKNGNS